VRAVLESFYAGLGRDPLLVPSFADVDLAAHLPRIADFWSTLLFRTARYDGNVFRPHLAMPGLTARHFVRWLDALGRPSARPTPGRPPTACSTSRTASPGACNSGSASHPGDPTTSIRTPRPPPRRAERSDYTLRAVAYRTGRPRTSSYASGASARASARVAARMRGGRTGA